MENGIWNANRYFDLGIGVPKTFSAENWAKTAPAQRHFMVSDLQNSTELVGMSALDLTLENGIVTKV